MKGLRYAICVLILLGMGIGIPTIAADRSEFRMHAPLTGGEESAVPIRLPLSREVIAATACGLADIRLFDDQGKEIPYVIYTQRSPQQTSTYFEWKVTDYQTVDNTQTIIMERPKQGGVFNTITIKTTARNFQKDIKIYTSSDHTVWKSIATGTIFDFSPHINLRKKMLELPTTDARYLKVVLNDKSRPMKEGETIRLRYKDLEFVLSGLKIGEIKIDGFSSILKSIRPESPLFDQAIYSKFQTFLDKDMNTTVALCRVNLPIERVLLKINNAYYYRTIELWAAETDDEQSYRRVAQDSVYKIPGVAETQNTLSFDQPQQPYVRLKVINHDNPPLQIEEVTIEWLRRNLYFIPEADRRYTLYCGGENIEAPYYEAAKLVPNRYDQLMGYAEWNIEALKKNEMYKPKADLRTQEKLEKYLLTILVIVLACGLAVWTFRLIKKIPGRKNS
jgi:hypothetical protein